MVILHVSAKRTNEVQCRSGHGRIGNNAHDLQNDDHYAHHGHIQGKAVQCGIGDDFEDEEVEIFFILFVIVILIILPLTLVIIHERQMSKCPSCGKLGLKVIEKRVIEDSMVSRTVIEILHCPHCNRQHKRTKQENRPGGGGPIIFGGMGGFGGGRGGGFGGGGFGGGSFGGGGGGSRW